MQIEFSGIPMSPLKQYSQLPVHIVEYHNEALLPICRSLATEHLPYENNLMIHFDSHAEMLLERELQSSKEISYENLGLDSWILPAVFAGHFNSIIWVKPHWSKQIAEGHYSFAVGVEKESQCLRVSCEVPYYISKMLYCKEEDMERIHNFDLFVVTLAEGYAQRFARPEFLNVQKVKDLIEQHDGKYILDIDLDFFSTNNPFTKILAFNGYDKLKPIYELEGNVLKFLTLYEAQEHRINQIKQLSDFFQSLDQLRDRYQIRDKLPSLLEKISDKNRANLLKNLVLELLDSGKDVDWALVHDAGCTYDTDTILPLHISSYEEITELMTNTSDFLDHLKAPVLITIARSSTDNYCLPEQVDMIQEKVLTYLRRRFDCNVIYAYI